ncbi:MAG: hypothetical protein M4579_003247 [Chaenotheca gracillima]|nr:MAG: hypothetical protein M4579_003247 [Chaenotheca gracillima]
MSDIARIQEQKERDIDGKYEEADRQNAPVDEVGEEATSAQQAKAAGTIQKNYRGYRERRQLKGLGLDPSTRWTEAIKEARYRNLTKPRPRPQSPATDPGSPPTSPGLSSEARLHWKKVGSIARRAGGDDVSEEDEGEEITEEEAEKRKQKRIQEKQDRDKSAKMMDLQYFLEMVDHKHRYGSNLRSYHEVWKSSNSNENFFYWLDQGEGRLVELTICSRERLEREQVRYLSREERMDYLVKIDLQGRLCWAKNGKRIDTTEAYRDSTRGIVPVGDDTPRHAPPSGESAHRSRSTSSSSSSDTTSSDSAESDRADRYVNQNLKEAKGPKKITQVSAATVLNHLLRKSVKKNTWIFVADTSFRLYVGIKQSGAFQHSSFLHGARISAAGLIKIKDGQIRSLSPLSGHYRPPSHNFRAFIHSLKESGADTSRVSISKSYTVLVGLEAYVRTRRKVKHAGQHVSHAAEEVARPEVAAKRHQDLQDKSQSAAREREVLAKEKASRSSFLSPKGSRRSSAQGNHANPSSPKPGPNEVGTGTSFLRKLGLRPKSKSGSTTTVTSQVTDATSAPAPT